MRTLLSVFCVAFVIQLGAVLAETEENIPDRFKVSHGLQYHQDAGDKAATRSVTSSELDYSLPGSLQTPVTESVDIEDRPEQDVEEERSPKEDAEEKSTVQNGEEVDDEGCQDERHLAARSIEASGNDNDFEDNEAHDDEHELNTRGLFDSATSMMPSSFRETAANIGQRAAGLVPSSLRETAANFGQHAANMRDTAAGMVPSSIRETAANFGQHAANMRDTAAGMVPSSIRETAANVGQHAANMRDTAAGMIQNPQAARESIQKALASAKERVLSPEMRGQMQGYYKSGLDHGLEAYKDLNRRLSPTMARTLNHGVSSAIRGVQTVKESPMVKTIADKVSSFLP